VISPPKLILNGREDVFRLGNGFGGGLSPLLRHFSKCPAGGICNELSGSDFPGDQNRRECFANVTITAQISQELEYRSKQLGQEVVHVN
jgi:hypothetical protein